MNNTIHMYDFYTRIMDIRYNKRKVVNTLKTICKKKIVHKKTLYSLLIRVQEYIVCLYFDINPLEKTNITVFLSCDTITDNQGSGNVSSFDINFKENIAEDNYISKYKSISHNTNVQRHGLFNIHVILLLCRIFGVSRYIINDSSDIWNYHFIRYRKSYYQRVGFVPLHTKKYNKAIKIINNLTIDEYKKMYYKKFQKYPNIKMLQGKKFIKSLEKLPNNSKHKKILLGSLFIGLKLVNIFDITNVQYKFPKHKIYSENYFYTYNLQYIEK